MGDGRIVHGVLLTLNPRFPTMHKLRFTKIDVDVLLPLFSLMEWSICYLPLSFTIKH